MNLYHDALITLINDKNCNNHFLRNHNKERFTDQFKERIQGNNQVDSHTVADRWGQQKPNSCF